VNFDGSISFGEVFIDRETPKEQFLCAINEVDSYIKLRKASLDRLQKGKSTKIFKGNSF